MAMLNQDFNTYMESWMGPIDQRVRGWLLLDDYTPTFALTVIYLLIVWMGPKYMRHRQPYSCRGLMVLYNLGLTLLSFYMFYELVAAMWEGGYNFYCQNTHSSQEADVKITKVLWWYYFSKLIEFMDTFFFILRKNNHQITFLHIYHHASMPNIWWFVMNWIPCGHSYFGASLNSFVHVVMYSYYGLSSIPAMRPYLWWKKYITQLQLIQFFLTVFHTMSAVIWPCGFPMGWLYFQISYMITLIILFSNFYIQTYKKRIVSHKKEHHNGSPVSPNGHANGTSSMENKAPKKLRVE
ncbi:elongation of very long chain fatty acids protein 5 [Thalassophryne amazonica]|uniref:elongation of very long chain fatty acids protein 5 n=1 Tax=Thalassophryne amazonica TaxID=390379 RepID=UPI0014711127|nr:elongation of very long chain fatty acids protein 5 [Thalassophryne amazonica]